MAMLLLAATVRPKLIYLFRLQAADIFPPTISVNTNTLSANLTNGAESTQTFTISNTGSQSLTYTMVVSEPTGRNEAISPVKTTGSKSIAGSTS